MADQILELEGFINNALAYLDLNFKREIGTDKIDLSMVYPYIFENYQKIDGQCNQVQLFDYLGVLYESYVPVNVKKDLGQFYTRESTVIEKMLDSVDILAGKILEPSCGSGLFLVRIIERVVVELQKQSFSAEDILDYICNNIHANDYDRNALKIAEINMLATLLPLIICVVKENPKYVMKQLKITQNDFTQKNVFKREYDLIIGNPPFVTMYGKRSRNMTEEKRAYFNTFNFVQNKKGNNKFNLSMFFIENGLNILKKSGRLIFILDIAFFEMAFLDIRKYIVEKYYINSIITGLQEFEGVSSGQLIIDITNISKFNKEVKMVDYSTKKVKFVDQLTWNNPQNKYKFDEPLNEIQKSINSKIIKYDNLEKYFPKKSLRTCCALTGKTEEFIVKPSEKGKNNVFPYIEGAKGLKGKFFAPTPNRYIKYDYELQLKLSDEFKKELGKLGVKNKKRVTLGDRDAYLSPKIFIRQSANEIIATYCSEAYAANNSIYILTTKERTEESVNMLKYTCGLLNSDLITFYCRINKIIRTGKGKTPQIKISDLKNVRINVNRNYYERIINLVEKLLEKPNDKNAYRELNIAVYELYGINAEEREYINHYLMK